MLGRQDERATTTGTRSTRPLARVQLRGRKDGRILLAVAPLTVGERVDAEVQEERQLVTLPVEL